MDSIVANLAERAGKNTEKEFKHFLFISLSLALEVLLDVPKELNFINESTQYITLGKFHIVQNKFNKFITKLKNECK